MQNKKFTDDELLELLKRGVSHRSAAKVLGVHHTTIRERAIRLAQKGYSPQHNYIHTVPEGYVIKGVSQYYDSEGNVTNQWVKSRLDPDQSKEHLKDLIKGFVDELPKYETSPNIEELNESDLLAVFPIGDPHIGMLSWKEETGDSWDLEKAEDVLVKTFFNVANQARLKSNKTAVLALLGDNFHYDNLQGITTRSHNILDKDSRPAKMIRVGIRIFRQMISILLRFYENVHVIVCRGNHDDILSTFLREALPHVYENEPRVTIDISPAPYHYYVHGLNLLGFHHGDTCKMEKLPGVMACDEPDKWGKTKYRQWLTGHIHKSLVKDENMGCVVESFNIMAPKDYYACETGWRSGRTQQCLFFHEKQGPKGRIIENL